MILFGGYNGSSYLSDTWAWNGTAWSQLTATASPSARTDSQMAYDPATGQVLLFGGSNGSALGDTWAWNGTTWAQLVPSTSPAAQYNGAMMYDTASSDMVLFSGENSGGGFLNTTWLIGAPIVTAVLPNSGRRRGGLGAPSPAWGSRESDRGQLRFFARRDLCAVTSSTSSHGHRPGAGTAGTVDITVAASGPGNKARDVEG